MRNSSVGSIRHAIAEVLLLQSTHPSALGDVMSIDLDDLIPGERIVCEARVHPIQLFLPSIVAGLLILIAVVLLVGAISPNGSFGGTMLLAVGALTLIVIAFALAASVLMDWQSRRVILTNKRLFVKSGVLEERAMSIFHRSTESAAVRQGILGRTFGFGTVVLREHEGTMHHFKKIVEPTDFVRHLQGQMGREDE
jgi:hypothetical protein